MKPVFQIIISLFLVLLLIGVVMATFRFLIGVAVFIGLIGLALKGVNYWNERRTAERIRVPSGRPMNSQEEQRQEREARRELERLEKSHERDGEKPTL